MARRSAHRAPDRPTMEHHHRDIRGGTARAAVFGVSDGLVSNVSLVLGVAAGSHYAQGPVRLAGLAGLIAGAVSMAIGEYVSMTAQAELFQRELDLERRELKRVPEAERRGLGHIHPTRRGEPETAGEPAAPKMPDPPGAP